MCKFPNQHSSCGSFEATDTIVVVDGILSCTNEELVYISFGYLVSWKVEENYCSFLKSSLLSAAGVLLQINIHDLVLFDRLASSKMGRDTRRFKKSIKSYRLIA